MISQRTEPPPRSILVVEDHDDTARVMSRLLRASGYEAAIAGSLREARALCGERSFDLLIVDVSLPDGAGTRLLADGEDCAPAKGIIVSGHPADLQDLACVSRRVCGYLVKPISFDDLLNAVRRALAENN
jgi:DNA-binding NtrC family response regulator